jgi:hypothetical protein
MKTVKKATAWTLTFVSLNGLYVFTALVSPEAIVPIGQAIIWALAFAGFGYQATNVADNWQRSAHYVPELDKGTTEEK